ncbi:hypothetical protein ADK67_38845 [Saccharothrix sp. NRRL B-16348]|nr:hypothetical protein ADK67_38845 [Saccharothrix sp. NRRL B-16348]
MWRAAGPSVQFGTDVALEDRAGRPVDAVEAGTGRQPVVTEPLLCRETRYEVTSPVKLVLSLALLCFAVAISFL